jgi:pimeloyl-ACP methyl ester carboxylesterase
VTASVFTAAAAVLIGPLAVATPAAAWDAPLVPDLNWQPCADPAQAGFECATARVPLDYLQPHGQTIELAVIRHRATDLAHRIGSIFFNPGGPGAPGTQSLVIALQPTTTTPVLFPIPLRQRFDIVSWDTRGVGASAPILCFNNDPVKNAAEENAFLATLPAGVPATYAQKKAWIDGYAELSKRCGDRVGTLLDHVSTTDDVRDLDLLRQAVGDKQINYQGNSYGTFLGDVYANLFPDKVRAIALMGNMNAPAWATVDAEPGLDLYLRQQADQGSKKTLDGFLDTCGEKSTKDCAFSAGGPEATEAKWNALRQRLRAKPIVIDGVTWDYDYLVTYTIVSIYKVSAWPGLACQLQQVWQNGVSACPTPPPPASEPFTQLASQSEAVHCGEAPNPRDTSAYFMLENLAYARSGPVGPYWTWLDEPCATWPGKAADHYTGPWNKPTANPILLINITADPATPYQNGVTMSHTLANARLLTVQGYGHADGGVPSTCVNTYLSNYFINGILPPA